MGRIFVGYSKWIIGLSWEFFYVNLECCYVVSSFKDGSVWIWDIIVGCCECIFIGYI